MRAHTFRPNFDRLDGRVVLTDCTGLLAGGIANIQVYGATDTQPGYVAPAISPNDPGLNISFTEGMGGPIDYTDPVTRITYME